MLFFPSKTIDLTLIARDFTAIRGLGHAFRQACPNRRLYGLGAALQSGAQDLKIFFAACRFAPQLHVLGAGACLHMS
jgi:hypothetical protein